MHIRLTLLATATGIGLLFSPGFANGCWDCDTDPEPPTVTPEPPRPTDSWADRHGPVQMSRPLPCCIRDGQLVTTPFLFMSHERALRICQRAKANGAALIYECPDVVSPQAVK